MLWAVGIVGLIVVVKPSEPFKGCVHSNKNAAEYQEPHERSATPVATITRFYLRSRLIGLCVANFADKNERTIGALAAVALAVFTLYLWRATHGLRRYAGVQADDMQQLLAAARDNAAASASQAEAMGQLHAAAEAQERAMRDHVEATRGLTQHIPQIERAYISGGGSKHVMTMRTSGTLGAYQISQGDTIQVYSGHFQLEVNNHGKTPGNLFQYSVRFCNADCIPKSPIYEWINWSDWIGPGTQSRPIMTFKVPEELSNPVVYGRFRYRDIFGDEHSSGFILIITDYGTQPIVAPQAYIESD